jgi:hypothetical protein
MLLFHPVVIEYDDQFLVYPDLLLVIAKNIREKSRAIGAGDDR